MSDVSHYDLDNIRNDLQNEISGLRNDLMYEIDRLREEIQRVEADRRSLAQSVNERFAEENQ